MKEKNMSLTCQRPLAVCVHAASLCKINAFAEDDCRYGNMEKAGGRPTKMHDILETMFFLWAYTNIHGFAK